MITLKDVFERNHPLTKYENSILMATLISVITAVGVIILIIDILIEKGINEVIDIFFTINGVSMGLLIWIFIIFSIFMSGIRFIRHHNKAVQNGKLYEGCVVERKHKFVGARSSTRHKFCIQIDNGKVIKSPVYIDVPEPFKYCSVYYYKMKYYFSDFRW